MKKWKDINALYQIYPRSFYDSNGDGVGDIPGIVEKLDYIKGGHESLGIDAIWISPIFTSPMADFGYDISDYRDVDPIFGTLDDVKHLIDEAHKRDILVMFDYVPNHTSDQHGWFRESKSSLCNSKRDYYVWKDPAPDGGPPNNWKSLFFGSAWEFDEATGQYYLHSFLKEQPDLNWDNPIVRKEMMDVLRFWMDLGVDGFRADAIWCISKDPEFRDDPLDASYDGDPSHYDSLVHFNSKGGPNLFKYLSEMAETIAEYPNKRIIYEYYADHKMGDTIEQFRPFYTEIPEDVGFPFNFEGIHQEWSAASFGEFFRKFQDLMEPGDVPIYCFGNHDQPRIVTKYGRRRARMIALLELTMPGLPTIYNGDEIGMENGEIKPDQIRDPAPGASDLGGRDPQRTPMQWSDDRNAGFTTSSTPWLPVASSYYRYNVASEMHDDESFLSLYSMLLHLRHVDPVLVHGSFEVIDIVDDVLVYKRSGNDRTYLAVFNFSDHASSAKVPVGDILFMTNRDDVEHYGDDGVLRLRHHSGVLIKL